MTSHYTHFDRDYTVRTNIVIDDQLITEAQRLTGITTKKGVVEAALKLLVQLKQQETVKAWRGKLQWEGDLESSGHHARTHLGDSQCATLPATSATRYHHPQDDRCDDWNLLYRSRTALALFR
jgi:Arc/MetJ family transcription regulator